MTSALAPHLSTPRHVVDTILDALRSGDIDAIAESLGDDIVWHVMGADYMPKGSRFEGKTAVVNDFLLGTVVSAFDLTHPLKLAVTETHEAGSSVIVEWSVQAVTTRGRQYENTYCVVFTVEAGLVRSVREYCNTEYAKRVIFD
jgi:ketosteroid isomerase-like protein